ncbi:MAG: PAS domain S-box protein [Verrucomicrobia bacterium]|nr:PAS domain S-box protein [Verrucomicrobiota bacterium]
MTGLRSRLAEAEETLRAIRAGEVDTVLVAGKRGPQVFTLQGAEHAYRALIESMNEGALTLTAEKTILYANRSFSQMVRTPLEQVIGSSFRRFLAPADRTALKAALRTPGRDGAKVQVLLRAGDGELLPVQISVRPLAKDDFNHATIAMVVTDMTEAKRSEGLMRDLTHRVVQVQESERAGVALELHDHITQLLCAILFRCQALVDELSSRQGPSLQEAMRLREMLSDTAREVERISRNLRPGALDHLGLGAVLSAATTEFSDRTGVAVKLSCMHLTERLPAEVELALYRIHQEAMKNVEKHADANHVTVDLTKAGHTVRLTIKDDGVGFDIEKRQARRMVDLGLLGMRERAAYVGGSLAVKSSRRGGTEISVSIPLPPGDPLKN